MFLLCIVETDLDYRPYDVLKMVITGRLPLTDISLTWHFKIREQQFRSDKVDQVE